LHLGNTGSGDNEVHEHIVLDGIAAYLEEDMLHFAYPDIYTWMEKHNRYSNWEAEVEVRGEAALAEDLKIGARLAKRRRLRTWSRQLPCRPALRFLYNYVLKRGFLDGHVGYIFCRLLASYEMLNVFKAHELRKAQAREEAAGG
jgi:hypothetical protein